MKTINNHIKPLSLCNIPAVFTQKKWATAIRGQSPELDPDLTSVLEPRGIKTGAKFNNQFKKKLIIKNRTNVCI